MADSLTACQHGVIKLFKIERLNVTRNIFKPDHCISCTVLKSQYVYFSLILIGPQRCGDRIVNIEMLGQRNGVF